MTLKSKSFLKIFIILNLIFISILCFFFTDIMILWFLIEISNFLFIYNIINKIKNAITFFYFLIQLFTSFTIIFSLSQFIFTSIERYLTYIIIIALFIKLRIPPFHTWIIIITPQLSLDLLFFIISIQKIIPFYILTQIKFHPFILYLSLFFCAITPPFIILNLTNLKSLFAYSSINQAGWLLIIIYIKDLIWIKYFCFYTIVLICILILIEYQKIFPASSHKNPKEKDTWLILLSIFNLRGLPPFAFFYFKWLRISIFIINTPLSIFAILLLFSSLIILFIYSIIIIKVSINHKFNSKIFKKIKINPPILLTILLLTLIITLIFLIWK